MATKVVRRGPSPALNSARNQIASLRTRLKTVRAKARNNQTGSMEGSVAIVAGGAAAGAVQAYYPDVAGIDSRLIGGAAFILLGTYGMEGRTGALTTLAGAGMLAGYVQDFVADSVASAGDGGE